jgi:hypothetical protein
MKGIPNLSTKSNIMHGRSDHTRVVPLKLPPETTRVIARAAAQPLLTYRNGPLLTAVKVYCIYWGKNWDGAQVKTSDIDGFFKYTVASSLMDIMSQYNIDNYKITKGIYLGSKPLTNTDPQATVSDGDIQHLLKQEISTNPNIP